MSSTFPVSYYVSVFAMHLPTFLVCIVAGAVIIARWRQAPNASLWALFGFGLALAITVVGPVGQILLQSWLTRGGGGDIGSRTWAYSAFSMILSLLHALVYGLLLAAIYSGRARSDTSPPVR